jgi:hypothetical protein
LLQLRIVEIALEALCVQTDRFGDLQEALSIDERRFSLIKGIVHFPEVPLVASSLGSNRCEFGTGMGTLIGVVAEDVDHSLAKSASQAVKHLTQPATVGTEIITVDEDGHPVVASATAASVISLTINWAKQTVLS